MENKIDIIIEKLKKAWEDDLPKTATNIFEEAKDEMIKSYDHQELCSLLFLCINTLKEEVLKATEEAIAIAKEDGNKAMEAIYHLIAGKVCEKRWVQEDVKKHYDAALSDTDYLASISLKDFDWITIEEDCKIFGDNLLGFIGIQSGRYDVLYDFYKAKGNRMAACYSRIQIIIKESIPSNEKYEKLMDVISDDGDLPVVCEAVKYIYDHNLMPRPERDDLTAENEYAERRYTFIKPFVDKFSRDTHIASLESRLRELERPFFKSQFDEVVVPNKNFTLPLTYRNITTLTINVYPTDFIGREAKFGTPSFNRYHIKKVPVYSKTYNYRNEKSYWTEESELEIEGLPLGVYMIEMVSNNGGYDKILLHVSNVIAIAEHLPCSRMRIVVVDNTTGHPIPNAKVDILDWNDKVKKTLSCDENGEVEYCYKKDEDAHIYIFPYTKTDKFCQKEDIYSWGGYHYDCERNKDVAEVLTDRSIYRPSQTIHIAIIAYFVDKQKNVKTSKRHVDVRFIQGYNKKIESCKIRTDDMGVAHCDFVIPEYIETGTYYIWCEGYRKSIRIEEYKRPSFEVKIEEYSKPYKVGDRITLGGVACSYTGVPIANAKVNYRVKRAMAWWWYHLSRYWETEIFHSRYGENDFYEGTAETDDDGHFKINVPMLLEDNEGKEGLYRPMFMNIIAEVDVVDTTGETQSARISLPLSNKDCYMHIEMDEQIELSDNPSFVAVIKNASGQDLEKEVEYWLDDSTEKTTAMSNKTILLLDIGTGKHQLHVRYENEEKEHEFIVFDKNGTKTPYETDMWSYLSSNVFPENGDDVILQIGCSDSDTYLIYNVFSGNNVLESGAEYASSGMVNKHFQYKKEYGSGIVISYAWVKNKKMQTQTFSITKPIPKRELQVSWKTFRDRVSPGATEKWILTVKDKEGRNVTANVVATLYDKSLDQLASNSWSGFGPHLSWSIPSVEWLYDSIGTSSCHFEQSIERISSRYRFYSTKYEPLSSENGIILNCLRREINDSFKLCRSLDTDEDFDLVESCAPVGISGNCIDFGEGGEENKEGNDQNYTKDFKLRSDMAETAFFMPTLMTDRNGDVSIEFTVPDSLTTWKFMGLAHTQYMYYAYLEDETIVRKPVMVKPNMPRFVRVGDETTLSAKISNMSEKDISGRIVLELLDASNEKLLFTDSKPFQLNGSVSKAESFKFTPDEEVEEYICRIYAVGKDFSDGEQHSLRVLPNKTEVTVTKIISQDGASEERVDTAKMLPDGSSRRQLSLQYTNKAVWLAIKALPAMREDEPDNSISVVVSLYCNLLTAHLLDKVKDFGEVENISAKELEKSTKKLVDKLKKLQGFGGGFKWFKDMPESLYLTTEILVHLCRLQKITGETDRMKDIMKKAFSYCDMKMCLEVSELKKAEKDGKTIYMPSFTMLQHMYNCAISGHVLDNEAKDAYKYLIPLLKKDIHIQTIREKAMSALILEYAGDHKRAQVYAESLRQYTDCDAERGRTFNTPRASYSWYSYKIPTHVVGMEALHLLCPEDKVFFREMQKWLLQEKRTQKWDTPIDCVNAVHALLIDANEYFSDKRMAEFRADGKRIEVASSGNEGYVETVLPTETKELTVKKTSIGLSWGAVYARFLQPMSDVESSGSGMTIKREIITDKKELHVGDRIKVRLTFTCERNFDFVTVIDSKAACMEPVNQLSWSDSFKNVSPRDTEIRYSYYGLSEGTHSIETEYYLDRPGVYEIGIGTIVCTYAPEFRATCKSEKLVVI